MKWLLRGSLLNSYSTHRHTTVRHTKGTGVLASIGYTALYRLSQPFRHCLITQSSYFGRSQVFCPLRNGQITAAWETTWVRFPLWPLNKAKQFQYSLILSTIHVSSKCSLSWWTVNRRFHCKVFNILTSFLWSIKEYTKIDFFFFGNFIDRFWHLLHKKFRTTIMPFPWSVWQIHSMLPCVCSVSGTRAAFERVTAVFATFCRLLWSITKLIYSFI